MTTLKFDAVPSLAKPIDGKPRTVDNRKAENVKGHVRRRGKGEGCQEKKKEVIKERKIRKKNFNF